jgi:hypothetical protein
MRRLTPLHVARDHPQRLHYRDVLCVWNANPFVDVKVSHMVGQSWPCRAPRYSHLDGSRWSRREIEHVGGRCVAPDYLDGVEAVMPIVVPLSRVGERLDVGGQEPPTPLVLSVLVDMETHRAPPEMKSSDRPTKRFLARYFHDGAWWGTDVHAYDFADAEARCKSLNMKLDGEHVEMIKWNDLLIS